MVISSLRLRWLSAFVLSTFALSGCLASTGPTDDDAPAPPPPPGATLDFSAIAGDWAGAGNDLDQPTFYQIEITVEAEAAEGSQAGTISYEGTLAGTAFSCGGQLAALLANGNTYEFTETITFGACATGGRVRPTYDAAAGTLSYDWFAPVSDQLAAQGVLTRTG